MRKCVARRLKKPWEAEFDLWFEELGEKRKKVCIKSR